MFRAGDVVVVNFPGVEGTKRRPGVVLSSDVYHSFRPDVIVGLLTSQTSAASGPTDYLLADWQTIGLRFPSSFRAFLATVPRLDIIMSIGHLSDRDWHEVSQRVRTALALLEAS